MTELKIGQVWRDCDERTMGRAFQITFVPGNTGSEPGHVRVYDGHRRTWIRRDRFKTNVRGYALVWEVSKANSRGLDWVDLIVGRWRLAWNLCPECKSDAPACDTCPVCRNSRTFPLTKAQKRARWVAFMRTEDVTAFFIRGQKA